MYKKILCAIILCLLSLSSFGFTNSNSGELELYLGNTINLKTFIESKELNVSLNEDTLIENSNKQILTIDKFLNITPLSVGKTKLVIINDNKFNSIDITIKSPIKEIVISEDEITLLKGEIYPFNYNVIKHDDYMQSIDERLRWTVSKQNVASLKGDNKIYTMSVGSVILTGTTFDGSQSISINVTVLGNQNPLVIKPSITNPNIKVGEKRQLNAFFGDKDVTNHVEWESQYPELLKIEANGLVTPLKAGTCRVTAKSSISNRQEDYTFFIKSMVENIELDHSEITFKDIGMSQQLNATLIYKNPSEPPLLNGYYYESSNPEVASVDQNGMVKAQGQGITVINAISYDSGKRASCSVEVIGESIPTTIDYTFVRDIHLNPLDTPILLGQKVPLTYKISPQNATDETVSFNVKYGNNNQIHLIDGQYYFIPTEHGQSTIKIAARGAINHNEVVDEIRVSVVSPLASLDLDLSTQHGTKNERKLYIGEEAQVLTDIFTQGNYSTTDVFTNTLEYTVDDSDILNLEYINGKYIITAIKKGTTSLRVADIEGKHKESLKIRVISPISKMTTDREIQLPLNLAYTPRINYTPVASASSLPQFNLSKALHLKVDKFYFSESYIDKEIAYEEEIINTFTETISDAVNASTLDRHILRLKRLNTLKTSASQGYCQVKNNFLKNRSFETYRYYTLDGSKIIGHYPSKAELVLSINGTGSNAKSLIYWHDNNKLFSIKEFTKWIDYKELLKEYGLFHQFSSLSEEDQVKYCIYYLSNKDNFIDLPSNDLLKASMILEDSDLPQNLLKPSDKLVTKQDLAYIAMYLSDRSIESSIAKIKNVVYYDVINDKVKLALSENYVHSDSINYFGVESPITYFQFKELIDLLVPSNALEKTINKPFTRQELILQLSNIH